MADSDDFIAVARVIESSTHLNEMQARGMIRRLLKQSGLDAADVSAPQLLAVGRNLLAEALQKNGVVEPGQVVLAWEERCTKGCEQLRTSERMKVSNTVEEVFARMGLKR